VITSVTNVVVTLVAISLVDRLGRRPLLLAGSAGMTVSLGLLALCFAHARSMGGTVMMPHGYSVAALIAANAFVVFFGVSWGPVVWVLLAEMFPNRIRAPALAVAAAAQWIANFLVSTSFPVLVQRLGLAGTYGLDALFAAMSFLFVRGRVPETRGRELEDMQP
jgi:SP family sugar:H+ symporter-like MFS transporter